MKTVVSLPDPLFKEAEATAKKLGLFRSKLVRIALKEFLKRRRDEEITRCLNRSLAKHPDEIDPSLQHLAIEGMKRTEWKE